MNWKEVEKVVEKVVNSPWAKAWGLTAATTGFIVGVATITHTDGQLRKVLRISKDDESRDIAITDAEAKAING